MQPRPVAPAGMQLPPGTQLPAGMTLPPYGYPMGGPGAPMMYGAPQPGMQIPPGQFPLGQFPPGQFPPGQFPPGQFPPGQFPPGQFPPGQFPPGQFPPGQFPPGQFPPGQFPPGQFPPGQFPPGQFPPGMQFPPGQFPPGQFPPGYPAQFPPGQVPPRPMAMPVNGAAPNVPVPNGSLGVAQPYAMVPTSAAVTAPVSSAVTNAACIISMTLYVGHLPPSIDDSVIQNVLELCGKYKKWNRPIDTNDVQRRFGFVTFDKGVGAMRCFRVLNGFEIGGSKLVVKAGVRETNALISIDKTETEQLSPPLQLDVAKVQVVASAAPTTAAGLAATAAAAEAATVPMQLNSLDEEVKSSIENYLKNSTDSANQSAIAAFESELGLGAALGDASEAAAVEDEEKDEELEEKDRRTLAEIEKFKAQKAFRDQELAEQRQRRLTQRLQELAKEQRRAEESKKRAEAEAAAAESNSSDVLGKKRALEDAELEARSGPRQRIGEADIEETKMLRRRQVLAAISGDLAEIDSSAAAPAVKIGLKLGGANPAAKTKASSSLLDKSVFGGNDEAGVSKARALIPIDYTEDEEMAVKTVVDQHSSDNKKAETDMLARQKKIADSIPVSKEGLFAFKIDWELARAKGIAEKIMRPWIVKKMIEYLGEEETVLINFIVTKLSKQCDPNELYSELTPVLDVDAEPFVLKLWRMFVFSVLKAADEKAVHAGA